MRIGVISHLNHPIKEPFKGGLERFTHSLTKKLKERDIEVILFASGDSDPSLNLVPIVESSFCSKYEELDDSIEYKKQATYKELLNNIDTYKLDVIHNNSLTVECLQDLRIPTVTTIHTPPFGEFKRKVSKAPHHFVFVSNNCFKEWQPYIEEQPYSVIHNGVDIKEWGFNPTPKKDRAIWYGRIHRDKTPHYAIEAALLAGLYIDVVGPISDRDYFNNSIAPWLEHPGVNYRRLLCREELVEAVSNASVFINSPSWNEPFCLSQIEALACGTPIAVYNTGAINEILTTDVGVIVKQNTANDLADAALHALTLNRKHCRVHAENHFDINTMIQKYIDLYQQLNNEYYTNLV